MLEAFSSRLIPARVQTVWHWEHSRCRYVTGIQVHQHQEADEVLFVLEGAGFGILGDRRIPIKKGSAIYIPKGVWHGVENPASELLLLWVVAPPGLEAFFREVASAPGAPPKQLTRGQLNEIARKHGMQFK